MQVYSQGLSFEYSIGYGTYQLDDVKSLQHSMLNNYGLKETDCFPNYFTNSILLGLVTGNSHFGSNFSYLTTGGRLQRADYSGSYTVDMIVNGYKLGAFYRYYLKTEISPLFFYLHFSSGVLFSNLKMKEQINIYSESVTESYKLKGVGIYIEPNIGLKYLLTNKICLLVGAGSEADFFGTMKLSEKKTNIKSHWNGFRFYSGIIFIL